MARSNQLASLAVDIVINARRFRSTLRSTRGDLKKTQVSARGLSKSIVAIGLAASAFLILQRAARIAIDVVKETTLAFAELEKQIIDIEKIAKTSVSKQFLGLGRELPSASFQTISEVMSSAARAGIQGADGIKEFSKAVIILSEVSGDIVPGEASIGIAQLLKNFDLGTDKALNLVNNIDILSDNFVTTSGAILTSSKRLAGFAETAGFTVDQLNAVVTVLLSTGATATTIRTTLGSLFTKVIPKALEAGRAFGLVGEELIDFAAIIQQGGPKALELFINTLKALPESEAQDFLKEFGIAGSRTQIVLKLLAKTTTGDFNRALKLSADSIKETSGALLKYNTVVNTTDTIVKALGKEWTLFKANLGDGKAFDTASSFLRGLNDDFNALEFRKPLKNIEDVKNEIGSLTTFILLNKNALKKTSALIIPGLAITLRGAISKAEDEIKELEVLKKSLSEDKVRRATTEESKAFIKQKQIVEELVSELGKLKRSGKEREKDQVVQIGLVDGKPVGKFLLTEEALLSELKTERHKQELLRIKAEKAEKKAAAQEEIDKLKEIEDKKIAAIQAIADLRERQKQDITDLFKTLPTLAVGLAKELLELEKKRIELRQKLLALGVGIDSKEINLLKSRFDTLEKRLKSAAIADIIGGKIGKAIQFSKDLDTKMANFLASATGIGLEDIDAVVKAGKELKVAGLKDIFKPEVKKLQFKGLTQAWKDAVIGVNKKETLFEKAQKAFWKKALAVGAQIDNSAKAIEDAIKEQEELKIK